MTLFTGQPATPKPATSRQTATALRERDRKARQRRQGTAAARDIGTLPDVANARRRARTRRDFKRFCDTYLKTTFTLPWSDDHLRAIAKLQAAVLEGELFAFAMPRGSGKTSLVVAAAVWAMLHGHHHFVVIVGPDQRHAEKMLAEIITELETNELLAADFPEVCAPLVALERIGQRVRGQTHNGRPTMMIRSSRELVLPTIEGSAASGAVVRPVGITGSIRGIYAKLADGSKIRPSLVLIDDVQTDESAASATQTADRLETLQGAVLGLAGPDRKIAGLTTMTCIAPDDLADQLLDRRRFPQWQGERAKLVYTWPDRDDLWQQYAEIRRAGQRDGTGTQAATTFYRQNRAAMDAGAAVAWPARRTDDELSALQHAYNLRIDRGEHAFAAEYQNEPLVQAIDSGNLTTALLRERVVNLPRGIVPANCTQITVGVDVQQSMLFWLAAAWGDDFTGHVVAYGTHPKQPGRVFTAAAAGRTLETTYRGHGFEAALTAGLHALADELLDRTWQIEGNAGGLRVAQLLVDANWGQSTQIVRTFARRHAAAAVILPVHGRGIGASSHPLNDTAKKRGDRVGPNWRQRQMDGQRGGLYDANAWKSFVSARLATPPGDAGSMTVHAGDHDLLFEHLTAEHPIRTEARGRVVDEWKNHRRTDNHWWDCLTMAAVAASMIGVETSGAEQNVRQRRKVTVPRPGERKRIKVRPMR